jgi:hypothetical protein
MPSCRPHGEGVGPRQELGTSKSGDLLPGEKRRPLPTRDSTARSRGTSMSSAKHSGSNAPALEQGPTLQRRGVRPGNTEDWAGIRTIACSAGPAIPAQFREHGCASAQAFLQYRRLDDQACAKLLDRAKCLQLSQVTWQQGA